MNFIDAVKLAQKGKYIHIPIWPNKHYVYIPKPWQEFNNIFFDQDGDEYVFSAGEILNYHWRIYPQKPKTYSFQEALEAFKSGKIIKRVPEKSHTLLCYSLPNEANDGNILMFTYNDTMATNWLIEENEDSLIFNFDDKDL